MSALVIILCALVPVVAILLGTVFGTMRRKRLLQKIRQQHTLIPMYELTELLTPLEFEALCTGTVSKNGLAGFIVHSLMNGVAAREDNHTVMLAPSSDKPSQRIAECLELSHFSSDTIKVVTPFILQSLIDKKWLSASTHPEKINQAWSITGLVMVILGVVTGLVGIALIFSTEITDTLTGDVSAITTAVGILIILLSLFTIGFTRYFHLTYHRQTRISRSIVTERKDTYYKIFGLYLYMQVSGLDTMTPDYTTLDMKGLDPLYPYAVAAGLDPTITKTLLQYNYKKNTPGYLT